MGASGYRGVHKERSSKMLARLGFLAALEGVFSGLEQLRDGLDMQKRQVDEDQQEMHGANHFHCN